MLLVKVKMADISATTLETYQLQLQQVEAALTNDPTNEDLIQLKANLEEVIQLTLDLSNSETAKKTEKRTYTSTTSTPWSEGDKCLAPSQDGEHYEAKLLEILSEDQCIVKFKFSLENATVNLSDLRPLVQNNVKVGDPVAESNTFKAAKKQKLEATREWKKKKQQKKADRLQQVEQEREGEKSKWQDFNTKAFAKNKKGHVKRSIFATPESASGRVGVGTCGIGGKPMTEFHHQEKWRKAQGGSGGASSSSVHR